MSVRRRLASIVVASLAATAAARGQQPAPAPSTAALAQDPRVVSALELARSWLEAERAYERIPGISVAIVRDQDLLWEGGFGQADVADGRPAAADTLYSICSISKLFTSIAVMQQRDAGKLRLDDPVARQLSWFHLKHAEGEGDVTIEGLLTHASGLPQEPNIAYWSAPDFPFPSREEIVAKVPTIDALYAPEATFQYSNIGFTLLGEIVAATSGQAYGAYAKEKILAPLGLTSTTPEIPVGERGKRLAVGYSSRDREGKRQPLPFFTINAVAPAAGYASDAGDLARFASWQFRLLANGGTEVLKATTLREMQRIHWAEPDFEMLWGLGFHIWRSGDKTFVGHDGSCPGFRSALLISRTDRIATVFLANAQSLDAQDWAQKLYDIVAPAVAAAVKEPGKAQDPGRVAARLRRDVRRAALGRRGRGPAVGRRDRAARAADDDSHEGSRAVQEDRRQPVPADPQGRVARRGNRVRNGGGRPPGAVRPPQQRVEADSVGTVDASQTVRQRAQMLNPSPLSGEGRVRG